MPLAYMDGVRVAAVTSGTDGVTEQDFVISGIPWTPIAALYWVCSATAADTLTAHLQLSVAVTDGTYQGGLCGVNEDAIPTAVADTIGFNDAVIRLPTPGGGGFDAIASIVEFIPGGSTLLWGQIPGVGYLIHAQYWFGSGMTVRANFVTPNSDDNSPFQVVTGHKPDHIIAIGNSITSQDESLGPRNFDIQVTHTIRGDADAIVNRNMTIGQFDGGTIQNSAVFLVNPTLERVATDWDVASSGPLGRAITTIDAFHATDGFEISTVGILGTDVGPGFIYLSIEYGDNAVDLQDDLLPEQADENYASGFVSWAAMAMETLVAAAWNSYTRTSQAGYWSYGFLGQSAQWAIGQHARDGITTMDCNSESRDNFIYIGNNNPAVIAHDGTGSFSTTDGVDIDSSSFPGTGRRFALFQLERDLLLVEFDVTLGSPTISILGGEQYFRAEFAVVLGSPVVVVLSEQQFRADFAVTLGSPTASTTTAALQFRAQFAVTLGSPTASFSAEHILATSPTVQASTAVVVVAADRIVQTALVVQASTAVAVVAADRIVQASPTVQAGPAVIVVSADHILQTAMIVQASTAVAVVAADRVVQTSLVVQATAVVTVIAVDHIVQTSTAVQADTAVAVTDVSVIRQTAVVVVATQAVATVDVDRVVQTSTAVQAVSAVSTVSADRVSLGSGVLQASAVVVNVSADRIVQTTGVDVVADPAVTVIAVDHVVQTALVLVPTAAVAVLDMSLIHQTGVVVQTTAAVAVIGGDVFQAHGPIVAVATATAVVFDTDVVHQTDMAVQASTAVSAADVTLFTSGGLAVMQASTAVAAVQGLVIHQTSVVLQAEPAVVVPNIALIHQTDVVLQAEPTRVVVLGGIGIALDLRAPTTVFLAPTSTLVAYPVSTSVFFGPVSTLVPFGERTTIFLEA